MKSLIKKEITKSGYKLIYFPNKQNYSGHYTRFIPTSPETVLDEIKLIESIELLLNIYSQYEIEAQVTDQLTFIDSGCNFEKIICPLCKSEISLDYWGDFISKNLKSSFEKINFKTNCCNKNISLSKLEYHEPCGFAKSSIQICNAPYEPKRFKLVCDNLKKINNVPFTFIQAHY